jgi:hypothetical protein
MDRPVRRFAVFLSALLLIAACSSGVQHTTRLLNNRLQDRLAPDIASGTATLQPLPGGAQITLLGNLQFPDDAPALNDQQRDVRSSVVEGMLDPALMQVQVADTSALPLDQRNARVRNVVQYFAAYGLAPSLLPVPPEQASPSGAAAAGLTITIGIQCPGRHDGPGYGDGKSKPVCD